MRYVAAYLLLVLGGKASPTAADIDKLLNSVGVNVDQSKANYVVNQLKGKTLEAIMAEGAKKLGNMGAAAGGGGSSSTPAVTTESKPEEKEEVKDDEPDESDDDMGFGLFGDDDD